MFRVTRRIDFCYGHRLLNYDGKCKNLHGHNGRAVISIESSSLDERGMVLDFSDIKKYLATLLADAESMRGRNATLKKEPASYRYLNGTGATADNNKGLLVYIELHNRVQDRPNAEWAKNYQMVSPGIWPQLDMTIPKRGHELLRKWGEKLVEEGMLSP